MTDNSYINLNASSDTALMKELGVFIKHHRLRQNKTQDQLAKEAGIVRSTLSLCERGENISLLVFIQLLRALKLLHLLQEFHVKYQVSPLQLAKLEHSERLRAKRKSTGSKKPLPQTDW
jgi:transcriptional regulator with XRE-family HTH domain